MKRVSAGELRQVVDAETSWECPRHPGVTTVRRPRDYSGGQVVPKGVAGANGGAVET